MDIRENENQGSRPVRNWVGLACEVSAPASCAPGDGNAVGPSRVRDECACEVGGRGGRAQGGRAQGGRAQGGRARGGDRGGGGGQGFRCCRPREPRAIRRRIRFRGFWLPTGRKRPQLAPRTLPPADRPRLATGRRQPLPASPVPPHGRASARLRSEPRAREARARPSARLQGQSAAQETFKRGWCRGP